MVARARLVRIGARSGCRRGRTARPRPGRRRCSRTEPPTTRTRPSSSSTAWALSARLDHRLDGRPGAARPGRTGARSRPPASLPRYDAAGDEDGPVRQQRSPWPPMTTIASVAGRASTCPSPGRSAPPGRHGAAGHEDRPVRQQRRRHAVRRGRRPCCRSSSTSRWPDRTAPPTHPVRPGRAEAAGDEHPAVGQGRRRRRGAPHRTCRRSAVNVPVVGSNSSADHGCRPSRRRRSGRARPGGRPPSSARAGRRAGSCRTRSRSPGRRSRRRAHRRCRRRRGPGRRAAAWRCGRTRTRPMSAGRRPRPGRRVDRAPPRRGARAALDPAARDEHAAVVEAGRGEVHAWFEHGAGRGPGSGRTRLRGWARGLGPRRRRRGRPRSRAGRGSRPPRGASVVSR